MESYPIYDDESKLDLQEICKDVISECKIEIDLNNLNFDQEMQQISKTLNTKECGMPKCKDLATMFIEMKGEWVPICNDLKHSVLQIKSKLVNSVSCDISHDAKFLINRAIQHHILFQIYSIVAKTHSAYLSDCPQNIEQKNEFIMVDRIIEEFKERVSELEVTSKLHEYKFIKELRIKMDTVCKQLRAKMVGVIAKYYLKYCKGHASGKPKAMVKVNINKDNSLVGLKTYREFIRNKYIHIQRKKNELKAMIANDFGSFAKRI